MRSDAEIPRERLQGLANELPIAARPRSNRAVGQRSCLVGDHAAWIEVDAGAETLAVRARAVRGVERERAGRHLRHAQPAIDAGQAPREQAIALLVRVDHDDVVGEVQRDVDRLREAALHAAADDHPVHHDLDRVVPPPLERDVVVQRAELPVDPGLGEPARADGRQLLLELALAAPHDRREHVDARVLRVEHHHVGDAIERLARDLLAAVRTVRHADAREEQPQVVVDFGDGADRRTRIGSGRLLLDGDGRRQPVDQVDVRLLHLLEELPGVSGQRLDIAPLPFGVDRVEGERRLTRPRQPRDDHQAMARDVDVDVLQVVNTGAANGNPVLGQKGSRLRASGFASMAHGSIGFGPRHGSRLTA